jgi:hypothetical protein
VANAASNAAPDDERDLYDAIADACDELHRVGPGDVLVFLPGEREIRDAAEALRKHHPPHTEILPLFARLSAEEQSRIFKPHVGRRIVLATNVAETSLTVPGIRYVVDSGLARVKRYSYRNKVEQLQIEKIAQASANQRSGRCGRVAAGVCIRLYDEQDFALRPAYADPEIVRSSLAGVILRMKALRLGDVEDFPFLEAPPRKAISDGYQLLLELGAVTAEHALTPTGQELAKMPLDPRARADDRRRPRRGLPARGAGDRRRIVRAGPARAAAGAAGDGRRRAPQVRRREVGVSLLAQALGLVRGRGRTPQVTAQAGRGVPREFPLGAAHARVARYPQPVARAGGRARMAGERLAGDLRRHPSRAARRAARQPRLQVRRVGALSRRARHQVPDPSGLGAAEEGRQVDRRRRDQRDHAPLRALRRAHRARVAGTGRRASPQAQLVRPALGKEGDAGDRFRAHHAVRHRRRCRAGG